MKAVQSTEDYRDSLFSKAHIEASTKAVAAVMG